MTSEVLLGPRQSQYYFWSYSLLFFAFSKHSEMTQQGFLFVGCIIFQSVVFLPCSWRFTERSVRNSMELLQLALWQQGSQLCWCCYCWACVCTQPTAPLPLSICEELWCCMFSPWEMRLVTQGNLYLCEAFELWGEDGSPFIPALAPFLGKVSLSSGCAASAAVLAYFTGGTELQGLQDALSLQTVFSCATACASLQLK